MGPWRCDGVLDNCLIGSVYIMSSSWRARVVFLFLFGGVFLDWFRRDWIVSQTVAWGDPNVVVHSVWITSL